MTHRIFNIILSKAKCIVECTFGVLANKLRGLNTTILIIPRFVDDIIITCCLTKHWRIWNVNTTI